MGWKECNKMDEKLKFISNSEEGIRSVNDCRGESRKFEPLKYESEPYCLIRVFHALPAA